VNKDGVELCNNPNDIYDERSRVSSLFDLFTGDVDGGIFSKGEEPTVTEQTTKDKFRREKTIIDVDVTKDD